MRFELNQRVKYIKEYKTERVTYTGRVLRDNGTTLTIKRESGQAPWMESVDTIPKLKVHLFK